MPLALAVWSLNHWTAREVPLLFFFNLRKHLSLVVSFDVSGSTEPRPPLLQDSHVIQVGLVIHI